MGILVVSATAASAAAIQFQFQRQSPPPLLRGVFPATRGGGGGGVAFSISTRPQICFPQPRRRRKLLLFLVKSVQSSSTVDKLQNFRVVPSNVLRTEKEEVKAVLTMFLKEEIGLSNEAAAETICNSVPFIDHLVARLHSIHKTQYLVGRELTTLEIRDALIPYLEYLCEEHEDSLDDVMENFRNPPDEEHKEDRRDSLNDVVENSPTKLSHDSKKLKAMSRMSDNSLNDVVENSPTKLSHDSKKLKAMSRMSELVIDGQLHPNTLYLVNIGLDINQIKQMALRFPIINNPSWGRYARSLVEFLLNLGVPPSDIPNILYRTPNLCCLSLSKNIIPSMAYLETLGLDKSKWAKVIQRCPNLFAYSRRKVEATVDYLYEVGLSRDRIGKLLTRCPNIVGSSVDNLRLKTEYFRSIGVNPTSLLNRYPGVFHLSIECKLKPVTKFFLDKGYNIDEIGSMASRFGAIYGLSLTKNLIPKWDFFLTMDYPRSELVKCPTYFGYSLEKRIKPRYALMRECDVKLPMNRLLSPSDSDLHKILNR